MHIKVEMRKDTRIGGLFASGIVHRFEPRRRGEAAVIMSTRVGILEALLTHIDTHYSCNTAIFTVITTFNSLPWFFF